MERFMVLNSRGHMTERTTRFRYNGLLPALYDIGCFEISIPTTGLALIFHPLLLRHRKLRRGCVSCQEAILNL